RSRHRSGTDFRARPRGGPRYGHRASRESSDQGGRTSGLIRLLRLDRLRLRGLRLRRLCNWPWCGPRLLSRRDLDVGIVLRFVGASAEKSGQNAASARALAVAGDLNRLAAALTRLIGGERLLVARHGLAVGRNVESLAVGEERSQFPPAHARPVADAADVEVDEG